MSSLDLLPKRFLDKVAFEPNTGCWLWMACVAHGYAQYAIAANESVYAHRFAFKAIRGFLPRRPMVLHHECRVKSCVNPDHLTVMRQSDHLYAHIKERFAAHPQPTACPVGHPYNAENTYVPPGRMTKACRRCNTEKTRLRRAARRSSC